MDHTPVACDETGEQFIIALTANTIAPPKAAVVMLLDQSNSMNFDSGIGSGIPRADVLKFSAPTAVVVLDDQHAMAVCTFDQDAHPGIGMTPAAGVGKLTINAAIAGYSPNLNGWTSIGEGVAFAHDILDPVTGYDLKAIVVLTDGQENHGPYTRRYIADVGDLITSLNGRVFVIGLGRAEVLNPAALQALCSGNNGYMVMTGDLTPDATYRLAKYYQQIFAGVTNNEIVLDPEGFIGSGQEHRITFWLNEADITMKGFLLTPAPYAIRYVLETPDGDVIDPAVAGANPMTLSTGCAIVKTVTRALKKAGIASERKGGYLFRHTLATEMLGRGASLQEIGEVLRHRKADTTRIYAKVDFRALRNLAQPWPGGAR
jgi:hypothetical protein